MSIIDSAQAYSSWTPRTHCNLWELSGQHEGDIMVDSGRNALSDPTRLWPDATVPYYIDTDDFGKRTLSFQKLKHMLVL